uniref:Right handed beta helix domain-containing protein n=1 Tax=Emiliania huxleyi TaxID=2903 RepID=A0A7S3WM49_EMIHU
MLFVIALALTTYEIFSVNELRDSIQRANTSTLSLLLAEHATYRLGGSPLVIDGRLRVQISGREGTVVDAAGLSRAFIVAGGGSLELRSLSVIRGVANASDTDGGGGCVVVRPDSALRATGVLFSECAAVTPERIAVLHHTDGYRGARMAAAGHTMARNALADFNIRGGADGGGTDAQGGAIASHGGTIWLEG